METRSKSSTGRIATASSRSAFDTIWKSDSKEAASCSADKLITSHVFTNIFQLLQPQGIQSYSSVEHCPAVYTASQTASHTATQNMPCQQFSHCPLPVSHRHVPPCLLCILCLNHYAALLYDTMPIPSHSLDKLSHNCIAIPQ